MTLTTRGPSTDDYSDRLARAVDRLKREPGLRLRLQEPMAPYTSLGVGGPAEVFAEMLSVEGMSAGLGTGRELEIPTTVVGCGTNLLVLDGGIRGLVLHLGAGLARVRREGTRVVAAAGATLAEVCESAAEVGLSGLEFAAGIPGSVGGAVAMNAGTSLGNVSGVVESIRALDPAGAVQDCSRDELHFAYRQSCLRERSCVAVEVTFALAEGDPAAIRAAMFEAVEKRCRKQPLSLGSCGSVFKRPPGDYAGRLLEVSGVKGLRVGGACFSGKHANFIVNEAGASARDILDLINAAKERVHAHTGITLEEEVCVIGEP